MRDQEKIESHWLSNVQELYVTARTFLLEKPALILVKSLTSSGSLTPYLLQRPFRCSSQQPAMVSEMCEEHSDTYLQQDIESYFGFLSASSSHLPHPLLL